MRVRRKLALTIVATGLSAALLVMATVVLGFDRFERENTYSRAVMFLARVTATYADLHERHEREPAAFNAWLRNLVLYEPDTQLYLLDPGGTVLSTTGTARLAPGFKVALGPVQQAAAAANAASRMPYVMGDDPERMDADAVIAARELRGSAAGRAGLVEGYLYLVAHKRDAPDSRWQAIRSSFAFPVVLATGGILALTTLLAVGVAASLTRPLRQLTSAVATLSERGLDADPATALQRRLPADTGDEIGQLSRAFEMLLATLRRQWSALRQLDEFRREGVSNLSHDLRSPLTATVACLETLEGGWGADAARAEDRRLVGVALRNARNASQMVQSLGELAMLDEPTLSLQREELDLGELLDDIAMRFVDRAAQRGIALTVAPPPTGDAAPARAAVDTQLVERAIANLIENALKFSQGGASVVLAARNAGGMVRVSVRDTGLGLSAVERMHAFDRFYQRQGGGALSESSGHGLGLAIVKRIAEVHSGTVEIESEVGSGTTVTIALPRIEAQRSAETAS